MSLLTSTAWPHWHNSLPCEQHRWPAPPRRKEARQLYEAARAHDRKTGALGLKGLAVFYSLLFDFLCFRTGRLDPSGNAIAEKASVSDATVWRALARLEAAGFIERVRRVARGIDGAIRQITNAYSVRDPSPAAPIIPEGATWGDHPPTGSPLELCRDVIRQGGDMAAKVAALESEASPLAAALARLGRAMVRR